MERLTRRQTLGGAAAMLATAACSSGGMSQTPAPTPAPGPAPSPSPSPTPTPVATSLNAIAMTKGLRFGSTFAWSAPGADAGSFANPDYAALLERDCGVLVPENELKWQRTRPTATTFDFARFDAMLDYAESKRLAMRGHTLLWNSSRWYPGWLNSYDFGASPRAEAERLLTEHIRTVCRRYGGRIFSYDVVNETIEPGTGAHRETSLNTAMGGGDAVCDLAFHVAKAESPAGTQLVYNDFMDWGDGTATHRDGVLRLLEGFKARGVPVDALGVQAHIGPNTTEPAATLKSRQETAWRRFLDDVVAMGYKLVITEFDVNDRALPADIATRDRQVAEYARAYLDVMFSYSQLRDVLAWGMSDRYNWLNGFSPRPDGVAKRASPYDAEFRPKPLYTAIADALAAAPVRTTA